MTDGLLFQVGGASSSKRCASLFFKVGTAWRNPEMECAY